MEIKERHTVTKYTVWFSSYFRAQRALKSSTEMWNESFRSSSGVNRLQHWQETTLNTGIRNLGLKSVGSDTVTMADEQTTCRELSSWPKNQDWDLERGEYINSIISPLRWLVISNGLVKFMKWWPLSQHLNTQNTWRLRKSGWWRGLITSRHRLTSV